MKQERLGSLLLINSQIVGTGRNNQVSNFDYFSHAESLLIGKHATKIKEARKKGEITELFTTLEPCFMCFGTAIYNRINRIIYACCPDPIAGAIHIKPPTE